jgi:hypothetical protein
MKEIGKQLDSPVISGVARVSATANHAVEGKGESHESKPGLPPDKKSLLAYHDCLEDFLRFAELAVLDSNGRRAITRLHRFPMPGFVGEAESSIADAVIAAATRAEEAWAKLEHVSGWAKSDPDRSPGSIGSMWARHVLGELMFQMGFVAHRKPESPRVIRMLFPEQRPRESSVKLDREPLQALRAASIMMEASQFAATTIRPIGGEVIVFRLGEPGGQPVIDGESVETLTPIQYGVIKTLFDAGPKGLSLEQLQSKSKARRPELALLRIQKNSRWTKVVKMAGGPHKRYRLAPEVFGQLNRAIESDND